MIVSRSYILAAALLFSTGGTAIKLSGLSSWQISSFRSGFAVVLLWLLMPQWRAWRRPPTMLVGTAFGATLVLFVIANTLTTAANAIFLQYSAPLYVLLLGPWLLGESNRRSDFVLIIVLAAGMLFLFFGQDAPTGTAPNPSQGNLIGAFAGVTWALTLIGLRWLALRPELSDASGAAVISGNAIACVVCLPMAFPVGETSAIDWGVVIYLGSVQTAMAYFLLLRGVRELRAIEVTLLLLIEPLASGLGAWLVHGETPSTMSLAGCALIFVGVVAQSLRTDGEVARD